jgi:hypothetical protein
MAWRMTTYESDPDQVNSLADYDDNISGEK